MVGTLFLIHLPSFTPIRVPPPSRAGAFPALPAWGWEPGDSPQGIIEAAQLNWLRAGGANLGDVPSTLQG